MSRENRTNIEKKNEGKTSKQEGISNFASGRLERLKRWLPHSF